MHSRPFTAGSPAHWIATHGLPIGGSFFDAGGAVDGPARYTALALDPVETLCWSLGDPGDPFDQLEALQNATLGDWHADHPCPLVACALSYDLGRTLEKIPCNAQAEAHLPQLWAARYSAAWVWDRAHKCGVLIGENCAATAALARRLETAPSRTEPVPIMGQVHAEMDAAQYTAALVQILAHIRAGDIYQACFGLRFQASLSAGDPSVLFAQLMARSPVPYGACLRLDAQRAILSISPERYLRWTAEGRVLTQPIKGTRPRGCTPTEDRALIADLQSSTKDGAEHTMIVDLERNDLGRVCQAGSVKVTAHAALESYATVHHLVSTVEGQLEHECTLAALLRATFPGGSITGAPKVSAMTIIDRLEPVRRGIYCGAVGYLDACGGGDLNIAIRTAWTGQNRVYYSAGGGIVADSTPEDEWAEAWTKAKGFLDV